MIVKDFLVRIAADGSVVVIFLVAIYAFVFLVPRSNWKKWSVRIFLAGVSSYLVAKLAAFFYQPESMRPFEKLGIEPGAAYLNNPGFPSDHALFAMFLTLAVWFSVKNQKLFVFMSTLTAIMCFARVLALVHTPIDVIGGCLLALIGIVWYGQLPDKIVKFVKRGEVDE